MNTVLQDRIEEAAVLLVGSRADDYMKAWTPEVNRDFGALTPPAVVLFRYENEEKKVEDVQFSLIPGDIAALFFSSNPAKNALHQVIGSFLKESLAAGVVVISESWTASTQSLERAKEYAKLDTLRDAPDAMSAIQAQIHTGDGYVTVLVQPIKDGELEGPVRKLRVPDRADITVGASNIEVMEHLG